jgi:hypothetical protein
MSYLPGWLHISILLICASWLAGITGMSHLHSACSGYKLSPQHMALPTLPHIPSGVKLMLLINIKRQ